MMTMTISGAGPETHRSFSEFEGGGGGGDGGESDATAEGEACYVRYGEDRCTYTRPFQKRKKGNLF